MKVAIAGSGETGRLHAAAFAAIPGVKVIGVCDSNYALAEELAHQAGTRAFDSFEALMDTVKPDAVSLTISSHLHKEYVLKAAGSGVHVICQKPISLSLEDAYEIVDSCERHGVRLFVGHIVRFFPEYVQMKEKIDAGNIGKVGVAHLKRVGGHPDDVKPRPKEEGESGGVIVDFMIDDIDFALWTLGEVKSVYAMRRHEDQFDYALVTLVFINGAVANLEGYCGFAGECRTVAEFAGTKGVIRGDSAKAKSVRIRKIREAGEGARYGEIARNPLINSSSFIALEHFMNCIRGNHEPIVSARDACMALEIANAARESAVTGKAILF